MENLAIKQIEKLLTLTDFKEKKQLLIELSELARSERNKKGLNCFLNEIIVTWYKKATGAKEFKTFNQWKEEGLTVKKGSKAFIVWARKKGVNEPEENESEQKTEEETLTEKYKFYPVCFLFSNLQVS